jgi:NTP pyrophosphatase (non-canonical NTP hydrolase)
MNAPLVLTAGRLNRLAAQLEQRLGVPRLREVVSGEIVTAALLNNYSRLAGKGELFTHGMHILHATRLIHEVMEEEDRRMLTIFHGATWDYIKWALETFKDETLEGQAFHLGEEVTELTDALENGEAVEIAEELADCAMLASLILYRVQALADEHRINLNAEIANKLLINRGRKWKLMPNGNYRHVEGEAKEEE